MKKLILSLVFVFVAGTMMNANNFIVEDNKDESSIVLVEKSITDNLDFIEDLTLEEAVFFGCLGDAMFAADVIAGEGASMAEWTRWFRLAASVYCK